MKQHSDKGRYLIAIAIVQDKTRKWSSELVNTAIDCILAYKPN